MQTYDLVSTPGDIMVAGQRTGLTLRKIMERVHEPLLLEY